MTTYLVATTKPWNVKAFHNHAPALPGEWSLVTAPEELTATLLDRLRPRYVFFPHWSWKVGPEILERAECVCFHAADVPYGRGGSPIQNLIVRGHTETKLTALRMVQALDAGPIYLKRALSLDGRGQDIFERMGELVWQMITEIVHTEPVPQSQQGEPLVFPRRKPEQSCLPKTGSLDQLFDHIRMLDAETYPTAFLDHGCFRLEFTYPIQQDDLISAKVTIRRKDNAAD